MTNTRAARKFKIPRAKVRERKTAPPRDLLSTKKIDKLFTKLLRKRTGKTWDHVYRSIMNMHKKLCQAEKVYVESLYDSYIELHPLLMPSGQYARPDGNQIPIGLFFVDASGILRESDGKVWTRLS